MRKLFIVAALVLTATSASAAGYLLLAKPSGGATNFLLINTGSVLLIDTGSKFLIQ